MTYLNVLIALAAIITAVPEVLITVLTTVIPVVHYKYRFGMTYPINDLNMWKRIGVQYRRIVGVVIAVAVPIVITYLVVILYETQPVESVIAGVLGVGILALSVVGIVTMNKGQS